MASVPPVEAPMATILLVRSMLVGARTAAAFCLGLTKVRTLAAALILSANCSAISPTE